MRGKFTTWMYESRRQFELERPYCVEVSHNDFTNVGYTWMWERLAGRTTPPDSLNEAVIGVGNGNAPFMPGDEALQGTEQWTAPLDVGFPEIVGSKITLQATFGERDGVFDWMERGIFTPSGVLIDRAVSDQGRKVFGAVWVVSAELELGRP